MGRRIIIDGKTDFVGFKVLENIKIEDDELKGKEVIKTLKEIAKREGSTLRTIYCKALAEYSKRHGPGNYQTLLKSYAPGGTKSDGQIEQEIINELISKFSFHELKYIEITKRCRSHGLRRDIPNTADRIAQELSKRGWKVWR